ncbi:hypothetical protein BC831DRAFT_140848 [Entophlyctis helioformis]|nr:hypothetical protein BC831DRAFT_140848 [Entophlyctis helioformis]
MPLRVFNVAVVGATGDGKSTLIKGFHRYANVQVVPKVLKVGAGHVSTTESCTLYSMHIKPKVAVLSSVQSDPTQLDPTQLDSNSLIARLLTDAENAEGFNLALNRVAKMTPGELAFTLIERADMEEFIVNIIDTPGCNDSDATSNPVIDADHTAAIARALGNIGTIHAVIFTIKSNRILDGATKACVGHFLSTFGGLCTNIIIAHTAFDVSKSITEQYKTNPNCPISLATKDALRDRIGLSSRSFWTSIRSPRHTLASTASSSTPLTQTSAARLPLHMHTPPQRAARANHARYWHGCQTLGHPQAQGRRSHRPDRG